MKKIVLFAFAVLSVSVFAQTDQSDIDVQVWRPFTKAIMTQNTSDFIALHSKDLIRTEITRKKVMNYETYKNGMETGWPSWKESNAKNGVKYTFELRFLDRMSDGKSAYEIGYYKNESVNAKGEKRISYGKFHVVLRKENNAWKILVDADSTEGGTITEEMFQSAKPIS